MIAIFPGHVGKDPGAVGQTASGFKYIESVVTFSIANKVKTTLSNMGLDCRMISGQFKDRINNSVNADYGICIHADSFENPQIKGYHTAYYPGSMNGEVLAEFISGSMEQAGATENRSPETRNDLFMLKKTKFPCALVEVGFLTNDEECLKLHETTWQWTLATAISYGILTYEKM